MLGAVAPVLLVSILLDGFFMISATDHDEHAEHSHGEKELASV